MRRPLRFAALLLTLISGLHGISLGAAGGDIDDLRGLVLNNAKIPIYQKTRLHLMIYADRGERKGTVIHGENVILELIRKGADIDAIADGWGTRPYPLNCPFDSVLNFWKKRFLYSDAVMITSKAMLMQHERRASGREPVFFRSPLLDLDGLGFTADFDRRTIQVAADVKIVIRLGGCDPRVVAVKPEARPEQYRVLNAAGDSLLIDMDHHQIMLVGAVKVIDGDATLICDRLTLFLDDEGGGDDAVRDPQLQAAAESVDLSRILADGNVEIERKCPGKTAQRAYADHLLYDVRIGMIELTGDDRLPRVISEKGDELQGEKITFFRNDQKLLVTGGCKISSAAPREGGARQTVRADRGDFNFKTGTGDFTGNVELTDSSLKLTGERMNLFLDKPQQGNHGQSASSSSMLPGEEIGSFGGSRSLQRVIFPSKICVVNTGNGQKAPMRLLADRGEYLANANRFFFDGHVNTEDDSMKLLTDQMVLNLTPAQQSGNRAVKEIICNRNVQILSKTGAAPASGSGIPAGSTLDSKHAIFFYQENKLVFEQQVHVRDSRGTLDCDKLELFLTDRGGKNTAPEGNVLGVSSGAGKELKRVVATGHVHMQDPKAKLETDKLTLHFRPLAPGENNAGGMFQSGSAKLHLIECDGNVSAASGSGAEQRTLSAQHSIVNLDKNTSELHQDVVISGDSNQLQCEDLYAYGRAAAGPKSAAAADDDPDADPFAIIDSESYAPSRVAVTDSTDLDHIVCEKHVRVTRRQPNGETYIAGGDHGLYEVAKKCFVITATPPRQAYLAQGVRRQLCDRIVYNLETERFETMGRTITVGK